MKLRNDILVALAKWRPTDSSARDGLRVVVVVCPLLSLIDATGVEVVFAVASVVEVELLFEADKEPTSFMASSRSSQS